MDFIRLTHVTKKLQTCSFTMKAAFFLWTYEITHAILKKTFYKVVSILMDFEKLYNTYYMKVYSYVMTIMKNVHLAEEITQEVFFKALKADTFKGNSGEFTYLCAIARNTCTDYLRKQSKIQELDPDAHVSDKTDIEIRIENEDMALKIHQMLHEMEEPYKEVFQLRIFGELSFINIGNIFGKTENWARVTYHRARLKIQERMKDYE